MPTEAQLEIQLQNKIFPDLRIGRPDFDLPHTSATVYWLKQIITNSPTLNIDKNVLLIAAYAHDWGYSEIYAGKDYNGFDDMMGKKALHMEYGAKNYHTFYKTPFSHSLLLPRLNGQSISFWFMIGFGS